MKQFRTALIVGMAGLVLASSCFAQAKKELTPQQQRMSTCAHEGKGKKGDEYKQFMKECLKSKQDTSAAAAKPAVATAKAAPAAPATVATAKAASAPNQKDKMKTCNARAKEKSLKGDARKTFMSECLKA